MITKTRKKSISSVKTGNQKSTSIHTAIGNFLIVKRSELVSKKTLKLYTYHLARFADFAEQMNISFVEELNSGIFTTYIANVSTEWKPSTCHMAFRILRTFSYWYEDFMECAWISPFHKLRAPKIPKSKKPTVDIETFRRLLSGCTGPTGKRDKAILMLAFDSALRKSEIINLNIEDIDLLTGRLEVLHGKGDKFGVTFVSKPTLRALRSYLRERGNYNDFEPLFLSPSGRFTEAGFSGILNRVQKRSGVNIHGFHSLRRGFGTEFIRHNGDLSTLQKIYRHSNISTTVLYLGLTDADIERAHNASSPINYL